MYYFGHFFHRELASCVSARQIFCGLSDSRYSTRVMPECDFFPEKRMKEMFAYVLEFMLSFDKMQNTNPLMYKKYEI